MAILLVIRWEVTVHKHPEYFSEVTNKNLSCAQCQEKLCHYKKQLRTFIRENKEQIFVTGNALFQEEKQAKGLEK